jgi:hypothetical protein
MDREASRPLDWQAIAASAPPATSEHDGQQHRSGDHGEGGGAVYGRI